jgi:hypothetical protein
MRDVSKDGGGGHCPETLALIVTQDVLKFVAGGTVVGKANDPSHSVDQRRARCWCPQG